MDKQEKPDKSLLEEVIDDLIIRVDNIENREIKIPDYKPQFKSLEELVKSSLLDNNHHPSNDDLTKFLEQQKIVSENMQTQISEVKTIVSASPKSIPIKHSLEIKAKGLTIGIASVFVVLAFLCGYCFHLINENGRLEANDIKYRSIRQTAPEFTHWADTTYLRNPDAMIKNTVKLENEALEKAEAQLLARQNTLKPKASKQRLKTSKKKK